MQEHIPKRTHRIPYLETYEVNEDELQSLARGGSAGQDYFNLMSITLAAGLTALVTLLTVPFPDSTAAWKRELFIIIAVFGFGSGGVLGTLWVRTRRRQTPLLTRIMARSVGPMGDEGRQIRPAELENLPTEQPGQKKD